jgi:hypothetical protein
MAEHMDCQRCKQPLETDQDAFCSLECATSAWRDLATARQQLAECQARLKAAEAVCITADRLRKMFGVDTETDAALSAWRARGER